MDLNSESGLEPDNEGWGWAQLLTSPGYTLVRLITDNFQPLSWNFSQVAGMLCGVLANLLSKQVAPVARLPRDLATRYNGSSSQM